jgi:hypothetical protein
VSRLLILAALLALAGTARAGVIVVDPAGGGDFIEIQPAVDAASNGDVILVKPAPFGLFDWVVVDGKALTIAADPEGGNVDILSLKVRHVPAGQCVVLRGLSLTPFFGLDTGLVLADSAGGIWVEGCQLAGWHGDGGSIFNCSGVSDYPGQPALDVSQCAAVTVMRSTLSGGPGTFSNDPPKTISFNVSTDGGPGLRAVSSSVALYECTLTGGPGGGGLVFCGATGDGSEAIELTAAQLLLSGCTATGGAAGNGGPGDGLRADAGSTVEMLDTTITAAPGGTDLVTAPGTVTVYPQAARSFALSSPLREGQAGTLAIQGVQGDFVGFFWSFSNGVLPMPGRNGWFVLGTSFLAGPFLVGAIADPGGAWNLPVTGPNLPPAAEGRTFLLQAYFAYPGGVTLGSGTAFTLVDSSL